MPRITKRQERGRAQLEMQRRLAQAQQDEAQRKALKQAQAVAQARTDVAPPAPVIADTDASV